MDEGAIAGYPLQDIEVEVYDGKFHPVDSKEIAFVIAARNAFLDAISTAGPQILEPIVSVDVTVPEAVMGDVTGNLAGRRARWSMPPYKAKRGTLYKYIKNVKSASEGCVTDE